MNAIIQRTTMLITAALMVAGCASGSGEKDPTEKESNNLAALLADDSRAEADRARDAGRKPVDVVALLGIESGMSVLDVIAAGGYYTEVFSLAVGPSGRVAAQNPPRVLQMRDGANEKTLSARLANNRLPNVIRYDQGLADLDIAAGQFDVAFTALNLHDIYNNYGDQGTIAALQVIRAQLKPGGMFGVIDHNGAAGNDNKALHRMEKTDAIRLALAAGFVVDADSRLLQNSADDMTQGVFTEGLRGNTSRFLLLLRNP